jgi:hypothetical protein
MNARGCKVVVLYYGMQRILDVSVDTISALLSLMLLHHLPECLIVRCFLLCTDGRLRSSPRKIKWANSLYATGKYTHSLYATGPTCYRHQKIYLYATQWHTRDEYKI